MSRPQRRPRQRRARGRSMVGERYEAVVGPVAHGGHCVARVGADQRVVFVRHALPGETVTIEITEGTEGDRFWRGDAIEVADQSPDRVTPPCPVAGPGLCGGCDFQHVRLERQRLLKADVVREQLARLAGLEIPVTVEPVPNPQAGPAEEGLRWRTRHRYATTPDGARGMRKHRSHEVVPVEDCLLESPRGQDTRVRGHAFAVAEGGFWQVHPAAPETLVSAVLEALAPRPGEHALDLYAGVGLFSHFLRDAMGETSRVVAIEGDRRAAQLIVDNSDAEAAAGDIAGTLAAAYDEPFDLVVLDPPRAGAKRAVVEQVVRRRPRAVAYVACDPAALARDVAIFAEHDYDVRSLRAFDLFPMTHHVECVALLERTGSDLRRS